MSRQNYYARRKQRQRAQVDGDLIERLVQGERQVQPRIGARKLHRVLDQELAKVGIRIGRDRFFTLLRERKLLLQPRRAAYPCTTDSGHYLPVFTNLIRHQKLNGPNQVWVSDVTYLRSVEGFVFLALITDKWSRKVVGHYCAETLQAGGCLKALDVALSDLPSQAKPIHHSDRGSQYCCHQYVQRLQKSGLQISMTETNHCAENALAERMNGILKQEYGLGAELPSKAVSYRAVEEGIELYNTRRPHSALCYRVPAQVHAAALN